MKVCRAIVIFCLLTVSGIAAAHHSNTPFDMSRMLEISGIVEDANFKNPHSMLTLVIEDESGTDTVSYEGHSLATLRHYGLLPSMVREGSEVTISYAPRIDGKPGGIFLKITTEDGEMLDFSHLGYD
jgi:cytochrome c-type biogenesis protein CcmE